MKTGLITTKAVILYIIDSREEMYAQRISRKIEMNYGHVTRIVQELKDDGMVESRAEGRKNYLETTIKGAEIAEGIDRMIDSVEDRSVLNPVL